MKINRILLTFLGVLLSIGFSMPVRAEEKYEIIDEQTLKEYTEEIGEMYEIDPYLLQALCEEESGLNVYAENESCKGLTQVSTKWHADRMEKLGVEDVFNPYDNILVCADFLAELYEENSDTYYVLMRYNMKISTANKLYEAGEISEYSKNIVWRADELREIERLEQEQEETRKLNEQKIQDAAALLLPKGGVSVWI